MIITDSKGSVLCQPDNGKSCGACCGLYNYEDSSRGSLTSRLRERSRRFRQVLNSSGDIEAYAKETLELEDFRKRYEVIYCCEYLGFMDEEEMRVGCLLHPSQNAGADRRDQSFYGKELCAGHLCPSHQYIPLNQQQILIELLDDWFLYGLCLTDIDLVTSYFRLLADRVGEELKPKIFKIEDLRTIAKEFFSWKIFWPFRSREVNRLGKYYFDGSQYMICRIDYQKLNHPKSPLDSIFLSLSSNFKNRGELEKAERLVWGNIDQFVSIYPRCL